MTGFKTYFSINCISFTFVMLIYSALTALGIFPPVAVRTIFLLYAITAGIAALMAVTDRLPVRSEALCALIRMADILLVVFAVGFLSGMIPPDWRMIGYVAGMCLLIYFGVAAVMMIKDQADAHAINEQLSLRQAVTKNTEGETNDQSD